MSSGNPRPWIVKVNDTTNQKGELPLCTPVAIESSVIAMDRDLRRSVRLKVQTEEFDTLYIDVPAAASIKSGGRDLVADLREQGVLMTQQGMDFITDLVRENQPPNAIQQYEFPGFHGRVFITPGGEAINSNSPVELAPEKRQKGIGKSGTKEGWIEAVSYAFPHFHFSVALCLSFVGVLIDLLKMDSISAILSGETSRGKSTSQRLGASAWGDSQIKMGQWISCRITLNALELQLERASGSYLGLDDGVHMDARQIKEVVFMGHSGSGKGRMSQHGEAKATRGWHTVITISDELGLVQKLRSEGVSIPGGLTVRAVDVSYDDSEALSAEIMAKIEQAYFNVGHAGPAFVRQLVQMGYVDNPESLHTELDRVTVDLVGSSQNSQHRRAATIPALVKLAGDIAKAAGLFPANANTDGIARELWSRTLSSDLAPASNAERAIEALRENLLSRRGFDILELDASGFRQAKGWYIPKFENDEAAYAILVSAASELAGGIMTTKALGKALAKADMLLPHGGKGNARSFVPGLGSVNCYVIRASTIEG